MKDRVHAEGRGHVGANSRERVHPQRRVGVQKKTEERGAAGNKGGVDGVGAGARSTAGGRRLEKSHRGAIRAWGGAQQRENVVVRSRRMDTGVVG